VTVRSLTESELEQIEALRDTAASRLITLADQEDVARGRRKGSDFTTPLKFADNIWVALTLEETTSGGTAWHVSVSVRGKEPTDEFLYSISDRLGIDRLAVQIFDDQRFGRSVRHFVAERKS
jgi:hypothetical protein